MNSNAYNVTVHSDSNRVQSSHIGANPGHGELGDMKGVSEGGVRHQELGLETQSVFVGSKIGCDCYSWVRHWSHILIKYIFIVLIRGRAMVS